MFYMIMEFKKFFSLLCLSASMAFASSHDERHIEFFPGEKNIQFLAAKYADNVEIQQMANQTFIPADDCTLDNLILQEGQTRDEAYLQATMTIISSPIFEKKTATYYYTPQQKIEAWKNAHTKSVNAYFEGKSDPLSSVLKARQSYSNHTVIEDIVLAAQHIDQIKMIYGNAPVLFVGRSGALIQQALQSLNEMYYDAENRQTLYHVSFSGTPDVDNVRVNDDYKKTHATLAKNFVTPEKLAYFMNYCDEQGLWNITDKVYIADVIGTGGSLNSFIRILNYYYETHLGRAAPVYEFIGISLPYISFKEPSRGLFSFNVNERTLTFEGDRAFGIVPMTITAHPLMVSHLTQDQILDHDLFQRYCVPGIEFPAQKWSDAHTEELKQGARLWKDFYGLIQPKMSTILKTHKMLMGNSSKK